MRHVFLHIGAHKTGSTSIQAYMHENRMALLDGFGVDFYQGSILPSNHIELSLCAIRDGRPTPYQIYNDMYFSQEELRQRTKQDVGRFVLESKARSVVFSAEDLCYLRHPEEIETLKSLLPEVSISVLVCTRNRSAFLSSYARMMTHMGMRPPSSPSSFNYTEEDSWLADWEGLVDAYASVFPDVRRIDYDLAVSTHGSVIPAFLSELGIDLNEAPSWRGYFLNKSVNGPEPATEPVVQEIADLRMSLMARLAGLERLVGGAAVLLPGALHASATPVAHPDYAPEGLSYGDAIVLGALHGWHWLTASRPIDTRFGFQIGLCDTHEQIAYRVKRHGLWSDWKPIFSA